MLDRSPDQSFAVMLEALGVAIAYIRDRES
jgi:hypothetical protein